MKKSILLIFVSLLSVWVMAQDGWKIESDSINSTDYYGVSVSNGIIGIISSPKPMQVKEIILAGVYDKFGRGRTSNFLPSFNLLNIDLTVGEEEITLDKISDFKQILNMYTGEFTGRFKYKDIVDVEYTYRALRQLPYSVMMDVTIIPHKDILVSVANFLQTPLSLNNSQNYFTEFFPSDTYIPLLTSVAKSPSKNITIAASNTFVFDEPMEKKPKVIHEMPDADSHLMKFNKKLKKNTPYTFSLLGSLISSVQMKDPYNQAERLTIYADLQGRKTLIENHKKEWKRLWKSDIEIEGDSQSQQDVRNMLYHLYSFSRENTGLSLSPMGLSGLGYNGHVFWDSEMFMFPVLLVLHPELAKELIEYRYNRLGAAQQNAFAHGYRGAMYPWESAFDGDEDTPVSALTGPYEHHISADVAIAAWQYYVATQDINWLREKGWPILKNTANFWLSRVTPKNGKYEILNVICADEWAENVDNDAYTNAAAMLNLRFAAKCARKLRQKINPLWEKVADNLVLRTIDDGITKEHDSYKGEDIKQADVNLLAYPLKIISDSRQIQKDLKYYETRIPAVDTPAMTKSIFALLYSHLGDGKSAYKWFKESYEPNLLPPFRVIAECGGSTNPYFITGVGGVLQSVIMGFGGININEDGTIRQLKTALPPKWKKLTITGIGLKKQIVEVENKESR